eukprot:CAMPEP_0197650218 /NCGR_PEP_ID=MMETSP1338-20131121/30803_1 /TAXON_ID=43686 ORGANISM="Pelagodinium beii, Strain RCC1491" /NCGR_SAMPLE_ID=MMETSP1338 /ASSEMBLY_ACC=CAM_ASM_000754 /LENGTH=428 /DNA_ID=CAMNT_0043224573 /DNA_START=78 /DNA_END=1364 /DNA_ORIENTATION=-
MAFRGSTKEAFLPWAGAAFEPEYEENQHAASGSDFIEVTVVLHGANTRIRTLSVPSKMSCADLKGHLAVEGVVPTCGGLEASFEEGGAPLADEAELHLVEGQVVHLTRAASLVSITALALGAGERADEEVYELVVPGEVTGLLLRMAIEQATAGALRPAAVFISEPGSEEAAHAVGDEETISLEDEQAIIVQRETPTEEHPVLVPVAAPAPPPPASKGFFSALKSKLIGSRGSKQEGPPSSFCIRCASNMKVKGSVVSCTSSEPWSSCAIFDVPDPSFFELCVELLADAPSAEADSLASRWMLGLVPLQVAAEAGIKSEAGRRQLLSQGYFVTVCHGHPAKVHTPGMARGTCGEDCAALPGELRKGQTLTIRWAAAGATFSVQVDDCDTITLPYSPGYTDVRPCIVFGGKPAEVSVLQLKPGQEWGGA